MTIPKELEGVLCSDPDFLSGEVRFVGTRVPVRVFLDTMLHGHSIESFLDGYPGVTRSQVEAVLRYEQNHLRIQLGLDLAS